jgi:hypothetical protein
MHTNQAAGSAGTYTIRTSVSSSSSSSSSMRLQLIMYVKQAAASAEGAMHVTSSRLRVHACCDMCRFGQNVCLRRGRCSSQCVCVFLELPGLVALNDFCTSFHCKTHQAIMYDWHADCSCVYLMYSCLLACCHLCPCHAVQVRAALLPAGSAAGG